MRNIEEEKIKTVPDIIKELQDELKEAKNSLRHLQYKNIEILQVQEAKYQAENKNIQTKVSFLEDLIFDLQKL